ncbi:murein transglycosylase A [Qipengyuania algicida]|uniref:murein transglycosylase A n=1 Tax=Qipengyuania algicida TaxID=1836209 RepID=UPI003B0133BB
MQLGFGRLVSALTAVALLAGCAQGVPAGHGPGTEPAPPPARPQIVQGPSVASLAITPAKARAVLASFVESCPAMLAQTDASHLTTADDWRPVCSAAATWPANDASRFFTTYFDTVKMGDGTSFVTGYFEPEIHASLTEAPGYQTPIYKLPPDLVRAWPADTPPEQQTGKPPLGRYDASGNFVPYYTRAQIDDGALAGKGLEIAWAADPAEFFFLQVQGSGLLRLPDQSLMRIGYAGQNGHGYVAIGRVMRQQGLLGDGPGQYPPTMQGILAYIHEHPAEGEALMRQNPSYIFFRVLNTDGPLGAMGVPVRGRASVAADPAYTPLGAPVWLDVDRSEADGLWVAQDTGGAIKGANRFDTFWGNGEQAREIAGGMSARGTALVLLPKGVVERLTGR